MRISLFDSLFNSTALSRSRGPQAALCKPVPTRVSGRNGRLSLYVGIKLIALLMGSACLHGQPPCTPPQSMKTILQGKPTAAAFTDLGVWFAGQQQYACAANAFATSLQMEPEQKGVAQVAFMFGTSLYLSGDKKEAVDALREAEHLGLNDIKAHIILAEALDDLHSTNEAAQEWRAALSLDPESSTALDSLSSDLLIENDFNGTIALLDSPRLLGQRTPQQSINLANAYAGTAQLDKAEAVLRDGLNTSPESLDLANRLADILIRLSRRDEAVTVLDLALAQHPDDPGIAIHYLSALIDVHPERANEVAQRLVLAFPGNSKLLYLNGILDMKNGKLEQARAHLEQSSQFQPEEALTHEALGVVLAQLNEMTAAKEHFQRAIALGDDGPDVKENLAKVLRALAAGK